MGTYAVELYHLLKPQYPDIRIIYVGALEDDLDIYEKIEYLTRKKALLLRPLTIRRNYRRLGRDKNYSHYLFHYAGTDFSILKQRPGIITIHDLIQDKLLVRSNLSLVNFMNAIERYRKYLVTKFNFKKALKIVTLSKTTHDDVLSQLGADSVLINQWVDDTRFRKESMEKAKETLNLDPDMSYVLSVGNDRKNKRLDLIKAIADSLPPHVKLLKIGTSINSSASINVGKVDDEKYPLYFNSSICYIHMSDNEGLGIPLLEALGSELPVICRDIQINREILQDSGIYVTEHETVTETIKEINVIREIGLTDDFKDRIRLRKVSLSASSAAEKYVKLYEETKK